jgi:endo-1,4-beta-xylanase
MIYATNVESNKSLQHGKQEVQMSDSLCLPDRRQFMQYMGAAALGTVVSPGIGNAALARFQPGPAGGPGASSTSLKDVASQKGLLFGSATNATHLQEDKDYANLIAQQCAIITPANELKMRYLRPNPNAFKFDVGDWMLNWAQSHGMKMRGHALVYGEDAALPPWFNGYVNRNNAKDVMVKHISTVVRHYAGKLHSWDVVNEALQGADLRDTPWMKFVGPDYLEIAYRTAGEADPNATLVYNENNIEFAAQDNKRNGTLKILNGLLSKKAPIHALGIQSHLRWEMGGFEPGKMRKFLNQVSDLGLKIFITELDCHERDNDVKIDDRDRTVAQYYADYLGTVLENKNATVVQTWNLTDRYTWLSQQAPRRDGQAVRPLPFDQSLSPKPTFDAMVKAFEHAPSR